MKVGKEDMIGLLAAVEWYLAQDEADEARRFEAVVDHLVRWGVPATTLTINREPYGEAGQPTPRAHIRPATALSRGTAMPCCASLAALTAADRSAGRRRRSGFYVAPETLRSGEEVVIAERLALRARTGRGGSRRPASGDEAVTE